MANIPLLEHRLSEFYLLNDFHQTSHPKCELSQTIGNFRTTFLRNFAKYVESCAPIVAITSDKILNAFRGQANKRFLGLL